MTTGEDQSQQARDPPSLSWLRVHEHLNESSWQLTPEQYVVMIIYNLFIDFSLYMPKVTNYLFQFKQFILQGVASHSQ